jgi:hypothetical protein
LFILTKEASVSRSTEFCNNGGRMPLDGLIDNEGFMPEGFSATFIFVLFLGFSRDEFYKACYFLTIFF